MKKYEYVEINYNAKGPALDAIALHGTEENFERVEKMSPRSEEHTSELQSQR